MQKTYPIIVGALGILLGAFLFPHSDMADADLSGFRPILNSPGNNATTTTSTDPQGTSVISLRYVANGATTTLPTASTTALSNQNGIGIADAQSVTLAYKTVGSTSPYAARFLIEYGYDIPLGTNPQRTSIEWFTYNHFVGGLLAEKDIYNATSTQSAADTLLATSTPYIWRYGLGVATTSDLFVLPTFNAKYMRIHAAALGSDAMFWLNANIRDYK